MASSSRAAKNRKYENPYAAKHKAEKEALIKEVSKGGSRFKMTQSPSMSTERKRARMKGETKAEYEKATKK